MQLSLSRHRIEIFLLVAWIVLTVLGTASEISYYLLDHKRLLGVVRQLSLAEEANIPTWYSALVLSSCALCLAIIGLSQTPNGEGSRRHWLILSLIFLYISMDETSVIHEMTVRPVRETFDLGGAFDYAWTLPAAVLMTIFLFSYLGFLRQLQPGSRYRFILAGLIYVGGAFGTEFIISYWWETYGDGFTTGILNVLQESMEIAGASLFLAALIRHMARTSDEIRINLKT